MRHTNDKKIEYLHSAELASMFKARGGISVISIKLIEDINTPGTCFFNDDGKCGVGINAHQPYEVAELVVVC